MVEEDLEGESQEDDEYGTRSKVSLLDQHSELKKKAEGECHSLLCAVTIEQHSLLVLMFSDIDQRIKPPIH